MDATNLNFGTETFDGIVDKALLDCIMVIWQLKLVWLKRTRECI